MTITLPSQATGSPRDGWPLRSELDVLSDQLRGIDAWNAANSAREVAERATTMTREMRLDVTRRLQARRAEQQALLERARQHMERSAEVLGLQHVQPRAVVVHRNAWLSGKVVEGLEARGVCVVAVLQDGAQAAGALVVEQPELVLVEDRLPTLPGLDVIGRVRRFCPHTLAAAQLLDASRVEEFLAAGARAVFTRRIPPAQLVDTMLSCLADRQPVAVS